MRIHLPDGLAARAPLVVVLHGCGQTADGYAAGSGWITLADRFGFALLCPEQTRNNNGNLCFNWFEPGDIARASGEAESIAAMVRHVIADHDLDGSRVFVTGLSAGGAMSVAMLATYPEMFAGGAVIAGLPYGSAGSMTEAFAAMNNSRTTTASAAGDAVRVNELMISTRVEREARPGVVPAAELGEKMLRLVQSEVRGQALEFTRLRHFLAPSA
jgi:feruloyl esterase